MPASATSRSLPEVSAAAAIEMSEVPYTPLQPCVSARLLGSHLHEDGPTILELFYLLRVHGIIQEQVGTGPINRRNDWVVRWDGGSIPLIEQPALVGAGGASTGFGPGQRLVNAFDAFQEFMLLEGPLATGLIKQEHRVVEFSGETQLPIDEWSKVAGADLADLQRAFVKRWWEVESRETADRDFEAMLALLRQDVDVMDQATARQRTGSGRSSRCCGRATSSVVGFRRPRTSHISLRHQSAPRLVAAIVALSAVAAMALAVPASVRGDSLDAADVVLVIDHSLSMQESDPEGRRIEAARDLIDTIAAFTDSFDVRVGGVGFRQSVR